MTTDAPTKDVIKAVRRGVTQRVRFSVLSRDRYSCRYCGVTAEDAALHVDHVIPVSAGGSSHIDNLVTACADCNGGKLDMLLHHELVDAVAPRARHRASGTAQKGKNYVDSTGARDE